MANIRMRSYFASYKKLANDMHQGDLLYLWCIDNTDHREKDQHKFILHGYVMIKISVLLDGYAMNWNLCRFASYIYILIQLVKS